MLLMLLERDGGKSGSHFDSNEAIPRGGGGEAVLVEDVGSTPELTIFNFLFQYASKQRESLFNQYFSPFEEQNYNYPYVLPRHDDLDRPTAVLGALSSDDAMRSRDPVAIAHGIQEEVISNFAHQSLESRKDFLGSKDLRYFMGIVLYGPQTHSSLILDRNLILEFRTNMLNYCLDSSTQNSKRTLNVHSRIFLRSCCGSQPWPSSISRAAQ